MKQKLFKCGFFLNLLVKSTNHIFFKYTVLSVVDFPWILTVVHATHFGDHGSRQPTTLFHLQSQALDLLSPALPSLQASTWCHLPKVTPF